MYPCERFGGFFKDRLHCVALSFLFCLSGCLFGSLGGWVGWFVGWLICLVCFFLVLF